MPMVIEITSFCSFSPLLGIPSQIVQQLVDERLRALEQTIFDKHFKELKDRVDKIDCATKHQTAINTLQVSRRQHCNVKYTRSIVRCSFAD